MDDKKNKAARKVRELTSHLEEEDLWDLEDSWEDEDDTPEAEEKTAPTESAAEEESAPPEEVEEAPAAETLAAETGDLFEELEEDIDDELIDDEILDETEEDEPESTAPEIETEEPDEAEEVPEPDEEILPTTPISGGKEKLAKKAAMSMTEKIALTAVAVSLLGLAIWGYVFLHDRNSVGKPDTSLKLPIEGKHVTISGFETYWKTPTNTSGVKLGAKIIPYSNITLADDSNGSGAFRVYFYDSEGNSIGDTITLEFTSGKFLNGEKTAEVSATNGFHEEGDFNAYVLDRSLAWEVQVSEASGANANSSEFTEILKTTVEPIRK